MSPIEVFIVYMSIGAAFGTHSLLVSAGSKQARLFSTLKAFLFWPVNSLLKKLLLAILSRTKFEFESGPQTDSNFAASVAHTQRELDNFLRECFGGSELYEHMDVVARYTGLCVETSISDEFFEHEILFLSEGSDSEIQNRCLSRRNRFKLIRHRTAVRDEFVSMLFKLMTLSDDPDRIAATAHRLVTMIGDHEALGRISAALAFARQNYREASVQQLENRSWLPQEQ